MLCHPKLCHAMLCYVFYAKLSTTNSAVLRINFPTEEDSVNHTQIYKLSYLIESMCSTETTGTSVSPAILCAPENHILLNDISNDADSIHRKT